MDRPKILVIDLRSQTTMLIERCLRERGYRSAVLSPIKAADWVRSGNDTLAVIASGGDFSVYAEGAPRIPQEILTARLPNGKPLPVLGICYGHQVLAHQLGGLVEKKYSEYDPNALIQLTESSEQCALFDGTPERQRVVMNHGDSVTRLPEGFLTLATSAHVDGIAAFADPTNTYLGVLFHPEVTQTRFGQTILENFVRMCGCEKDWWPTSMISTIRDGVVEAARGEKLLEGYSGGVDSSILAAICAPALGRNLRGVTIDADNLRLGELEEIRRHATILGLDLDVIDAGESVALFDTIDAEKKRKRVFQDGIYVPNLVQAIQEFGAELLLQGTTAPDLIESGATGGDVIKTHHNVGIDVGIPQLHPLGHLFKYEVRALGRELGLSKSIWARKPFPGPGLFIRIIGTLVTHQLLACVREADAEVDDILRRSLTEEQYDDISQIVVAYLGINTVGQKGDKRVYTGSILVRAIKTLDFMTAEGVAFGAEIQHEIARTVTRHPLVARAFFDPTGKPPGTTEFE